MADINRVIGNAEVEAAPVHGTAAVAVDQGLRRANVAEYIELCLREQQEPPAEVARGDEEDQRVCAAEACGGRDAVEGEISSTINMMRSGRRWRRHRPK